MVRMKKDLVWVLYNGHFDKLLKDGLNIFIVDANVFIDLENAYHGNGKSEKHNPAYLFSKLEREHCNHNFLVTEGVYHEIMKHRECFIGNRQEVSQETALLVHNLYLETRDFMHDLESETLDDHLSDYHGLEIVYAAVKAFENDTRKGEKDEISKTDIEILKLAYNLCCCSYNGHAISYVNLLSSDDHIAKTVHVMRESNKIKELQYVYNIRAIQTRNDLRSYMER